MLFEASDRLMPPAPQGTSAERRSQPPQPAPPSRPPKPNVLHSSMEEIFPGVAAEPCAQHEVVASIGAVTVAPQAVAWPPTFAAAVASILHRTGACSGHALCQSDGGSAKLLGFRRSVKGRNLHLVGFVVSARQHRRV